LSVYFALDIHEDDSSSYADRNDDELRPKWPPQDAGMNLLCRALDEYVERPDDAGQRHRVECHRAEQFPPLRGAHVELLPHTEWLCFGLHDEGEFAEFATFDVGGFDPLLKAGLVYIPQ